MTHTLDPLEPRQHLAAVVNNGRLVVGGTDGPDRITVESLEAAGGEGNFVRVTINGEATTIDVERLTVTLNPGTPAERTETLDV